MWTKLAWWIRKRAVRHFIQLRSSSVQPFSMGAALHLIVFTKTADKLEMSMPLRFLVLITLFSVTSRCIYISAHTFSPSQRNVKCKTRVSVAGINIITLFVFKAVM